MEFQMIGPLPKGTLYDAIRMEVRLTHVLARLPKRGKPNDAGYDISSVTDTLIWPFQTAQIDTGLELACPPGFYWTMEGRSSLNARRLMVVRAIIDATYCGRGYVYLRNNSFRPYRVRAGDRVAQLLLHRVLDMNFDTVSVFSDMYSQRGKDGFGSTGR